MGVVVGVPVAVPVAVGVGVGVEVDVGVALGVGLAVAVGVDVGGGPDSAQYLPPVFVMLEGGTAPPQTIISLPVQTAVCSSRAIGALVRLVAIQSSVPGSYFPPVLKGPPTPPPPQTIISLPVHTAV
jgi:hypothetical protein